MTDPRLDAQVDHAMRQTRGLFATIRGTATRWLRPATLHYVGELRRTLSTPGKGRFYKSRGIKSRLARKGNAFANNAASFLRSARSAKRRVQQLHRASAPGDPPAPDIGELRRTVGIDEFQDFLRVGSPLPYAAALEFGTQGTGRPSLRFRPGPKTPYRKHLIARLRRAGARRAAMSLAAKGSGRLAPRPFMRPTLDRALPKMTALTVAALQDITRNDLRVG